MFISKLTGCIKDASSLQSLELDFALNQLKVNNSEDDVISSIVIDGSKTKIKEDRLDDKSLSLIFRELIQLLRNTDINQKSSFVSSLETLNFRNNNITFNSEPKSSFYEFLDYCISNQVPIKHLDFQNNFISGSNIDTLLSMCLRISTLESINLSYNVSLERQGAASISDYLEKLNKVPNNNLKAIYLNSCGLDLTSMIHIVTSLSPCLVSDDTLPTLTSVNHLRLETLEMNRPTVDKIPQEEVMDHISRVLANSSKQVSVSHTLSSISLKHACVSNWGVERLVDSMTSNLMSNIRVLNLDGNSINNVGVRHIADYLKSNTGGSGSGRGIEELELSCNMIGEDGCEALAKVRKAASTTIYTDISV